MDTHSQNQAGRSRPYPKEWERRLLLPDRTHIFVRPVRPDDDDLFRDFAKGVSAEDARLRFFGPKKELSNADLDRLVHIDYGRAMGFVAISELSGEMVGVVRLHAEPNREAREFAIIVRSDFASSNGQAEHRPLQPRSAVQGPCPLPQSRDAPSYPP